MPHTKQAKKRRTEKQKILTDSLLSLRPEKAEITRAFAVLEKSDKHFSPSFYSDLAFILTACLILNQDDYLEDKNSDGVAGFIEKYKLLIANQG